MASGSSRSAPRPMPDWVVRYEMGTVRVPVEYHSMHGHAEKMGLVLYHCSIAREMARRQVIIWDIQDALDAASESERAEIEEEFTVEGENLEQHQKALDELMENGQRASEAFNELSERVMREERARQRAETRAGPCLPQRLF